VAAVIVADTAAAADDILVKAGDAAALTTKLSEKGVSDEVLITAQPARTVELVTEITSTDSTPVPALDSSKLSAIGTQLGATATATVSSPDSTTSTIAPQPPDANPTTTVTTITTTTPASLAAPAPPPPAPEVEEDDDDILTIIVVIIVALGALLLAAISFAWYWRSCRSSSETKPKELGETSFTAVREFAVPEPEPDVFAVQPPKPVVVTTTLSV